MPSAFSYENNYTADRIFDIMELLVGGRTPCAILGSIVKR